MNKNLLLLPTLFASLVLAGCSHDLHQPSQSVGQLPAGSATFSRAQDAAKVRTKVVTKYVPVAVPGQLMPIPGSVDAKGPGVKKPTFLTKEAAVKYANTHATQTPNSHDFFNAMATYNFMPGAMYTVYTAPMKITDIQLQPGEKIISTAAGDTLRWQLSQTYSGTAPDLVQHIIVKPNAGNLTNTLIVTTNKRVYHILLKSTDNGTYMMSTKWRYPGNMVQYSDLSAQTGGSSDTASAAVHGRGIYQLDLGRLNFNYKFGMVKGNKPAWYPVRVFNNGRQTFIEFPKNFYNTTLPILYLSDNNGVYGTMVNWRLKGRYMVVDTIIHKARLQTGIAKTGQTIVQIEQTQPGKS